MVLPVPVLAWATLYDAGGQSEVLRGRCAMELSFRGRAYMSFPCRAGLMLMDWTSVMDS